MAAKPLPRQVGQIVVEIDVDRAGHMRIAMIAPALAGIGEIETAVEDEYVAARLRIGEFSGGNEWRGHRERSSRSMRFLSMSAVAPQMRRPCHSHE